MGMEMMYGSKLPDLLKGYTLQATHYIHAYRMIIRNKKPVSINADIVSATRVGKVIEFTVYKSDKVYTMGANDMIEIAVHH